MKNNKHGFTLAELLIVVAIIGVLVAISIPIFGTQLEKSKDAVTAVNVRNAYSEAVIALTNQETTGNAVYVPAHSKMNTDGNWDVPRVLVYGVEVKGTKDDMASQYDWAFPYRISSEEDVKGYFDNCLGNMNWHKDEDDDGYGEPLKYVVIEFYWDESGMCNVSVDHRYGEKALKAKKGIHTQIKTSDFNINRTGTYRY